MLIIQNQRIYMSGQRNNFFLIFLLILSSTGFSISSNAQCCSTGSPVGASLNVGVLNKKVLRFVGFYRNSFSDTYYSDDHKTNDNTALSAAYYNFSGITLGYGITKRLTIEADFGYFFNKTQVFKHIDFKETGYGLSNGGITLKYGILEKPLHQTEIMGGIGLRYPFTRIPQMKNNVQLSPDVQSSTHAFGVSGLIFMNKGFPDLSLRLFSVNKYDYNFDDPNGYRYGNILMNSIFASKKVFKDLFFIVQLRSDWKNPDFNKDKQRDNTGYLLLTITPQLSYSLFGKWNISVLYDIPFYKKYNGKQLTPGYSFALSLSKDIDLGKVFQPLSRK